MSGECDSFNEHALECMCEPLCRRQQNGWRSIENEEIDMDRIHFLVDGDSIYIRGTRLQSFFFQLCGEIKPIGDMEWTHWMPLPEPPKE